MLFLGEVAGWPPPPKGPPWPGWGPEDEELRLLGHRGLPGTDFLEKEEKHWINIFIFSSRSITPAHDINLFHYYFPSKTIEISSAAVDRAKDELLFIYLRLNLAYTYL